MHYPGVPDVYADADGYADIDAGGNGYADGHTDGWK